MTSHAQTLTQRLSAGRLTHQEALRYSIQLVDAIRHAHEEGHCHGALTPDVVIFKGGGSMELLPAEEGAGARVTGYTAPEQLAGQPADQRTDIFALGALIYEMFTGCRAFPGETREDLTLSIEQLTPEPIGDTALDRLVLNCIVKDPSCRWQRVQQVHMELKILVFSAKRGQAAAVSGGMGTALLAEVRQAESRLIARMDQQYAEANAGIERLSAQLLVLDSQWTGRLEQQSNDVTAALQEIAGVLPVMESHVASRLEEHAQAISGVRQSLNAVPQVDPAALSRLEAQTSELSSRLQQHEEAVSGVRQSLSAIPQVDPEAISRLEAQTSELSSRLQQHEEAVSGVHQSLSAIPQVDPEAISRLEAQTSELSSRLQQHEEAVSGVRQSLSAIPQIDPEAISRLEAQTSELTAVLPVLEARLFERLHQHEQAVSAVPQIDPELVSRIEQQSAAIETLQHLTAEQKAVLQTLAGGLSTVQNEVVAAQSRVEKAAQTVTDSTDLQAAMVAELQSLGLTAKAHSAAIDSIRASLTRTDDFMERVVEALESLQTMVLDQARDRVVA